MFFTKFKMDLRSPFLAPKATKAGPERLPAQQEYFTLHSCIVLTQHAAIRPLHVLHSININATVMRARACAVPQGDLTVL
jgi:hypothetical protein